MKSLRALHLATLATATLLFTATPIAMAAAHAAAGGSIELSLISRYSTGLFDEGGAEIPAYDAATKRLFVVNLHDQAIDVLDISNATAPVKVGAIDVSFLGAAANSVSAKHGVLAVAIQAEPKTSPGAVAFYDTATLTRISQVSVGALPDMLTWTPDGKTVLVANEGEPNDDYSIDPEGSISVIDASNLQLPTVRTADFRRFDKAGARARLIEQGVRLFGPGATTSQDLEPEYIAVAPGGKKAWVTLQENNAIAEVDIATAKVTRIRALGFKDHSLPGQGLDPSDRDGGAHIGNWPVFGMYMPDAIATFKVGGQGYLITANEGDSREYSAFNEVARVKDLTLDPTAFPNAAALQSDAQLGRLNVTRANGDADGDGKYERLYAYGARSFSIWNESGLVFDSGDFIERQVLAQYPANFNADHGDNALDNRSDNKGPEPEGVTVASLWGKPYAFVGLERMSGVMVFDLSDPAAPGFVQYMNSRDFGADPETSAAGDLGPEGLLVIAAEDSPTGSPLLVVANEVSGSTALYRIDPSTTPARPLKRTPQR